MIISFKKPVDANVLVIISRYAGNLTDSPSGFEILGSENTFDYTFLVGFIDVTWKPSQQRFFSFDNVKLYSVGHIFLVFNDSQTLNETKRFNKFQDLACSFLRICKTIN